MKREKKRERVSRKVRSRKRGKKKKKKERERERTLLSLVPLVSVQMWSENLDYYWHLSIISTLGTYPVRPLVLVILILCFYLLLKKKLNPSFHDLIGLRCETVYYT